ncbi:MAG: 4-hydroxy-tetrahydrodipicolinate synthase [Phycisphaerae bacterium]
MPDLNLHGAMVAIVTPFNESGIDWDAFAHLIDFQLENGNQGLIPCGTTGESPTLNYEEHDKVIEFTVKRAEGKVPVIAGTGSNSTSEAVSTTQHAKDAGADACLVVNAYYNKPTQHGMVEHIGKVNEIGLPIVLYNIPGRTGIELSVETIVRMYNEFDQVIAVKHATGNVEGASALAAECDITILSGDDALTLPMGAVGGKGVISVLANILPAEVRKLTDLIEAGDLDAARIQHLKLFPLFKGMFVETNPIPIKAALAMAGMIENRLRLPMTPLSEQYVGKLREQLSSFGVEMKA